ncbi:MAG: hypothetical protein JST11_11845 [Acidobacteria bacterium]|nr:hypothetical protein [Acidobacteriota bacterium]
MAVLAMAACAFGQVGVPRFRAEDVRPHGSAEPHPLIPGLLAWIFGADLSASPGCSARNLMDPSTYKTELCGTRVLVGGIEARLIAVMPGQINLVLPDHPWEDELVDFQIVRDGRASAAVPVYFGFNRPVVSLAAPAFAGMPVWVRVEKPWGRGWLRYPFYTEPWDIGPGSFEVRFQGRELPILSLLPYPPPGFGMMLGLPREVPPRYLHRVPLHLVYPVEQPGTYQVRYTEYRDGPESVKKTVYLQSDWTVIEILPSTAGQRRAWFQALTAAPPDDTVELLSNFLPSLLAVRDEASLRLLGPYLEVSDPLVRQYAAYALNYFDSNLLHRVLPGRQPLRGGVR